MMTSLQGPQIGRNNNGPDRLTFDSLLFSWWTIYEGEEVGSVAEVCNWQGI